MLYFLASEYRLLSHGSRTVRLASIGRQFKMIITITSFIPGIKPVKDVIVNDNAHPID